MLPSVGRSTRLLEEQEVETARLDAETCLLAGSLDWLYHDPVDRMLATTALRYGVAIISADGTFDGVVRRIR